MYNASEIPSLHKEKTGQMNPKTKKRNTYFMLGILILLITLSTACTPTNASNLQGNVSAIATVAAHKPLVSYQTLHHGLLTVDYAGDEVLDDDVFQSSIDACNNQFEVYGIENTIKVAAEFDGNKLIVHVLYRKMQTDGTFIWTYAKSIVAEEFVASNSGTMLKGNLNGDVFYFDIPEIPFACGTH